MILAVQLGVLSVSNIAIAFLIQWYVLTQLGPGVETDALFAGMTVPLLVLAVISGSLMHVLVPLLTGVTQERFNRDAWGFFLLVGGIFSVFALVLYLTAHWWVPLTVPGFSQVGRSMTEELTRIQLIGMVFTALTGVQWAVCHARQQFLWAETTPIIGGGLALLLLIWALPKYGVVAAAWISTFRFFLQTAILMPAMGRFVRPTLKANSLQEAFRRIKPLLIGTAYYKTDPLVDCFLLSMSGAGTLSLFYLGQQIYGAGNVVINKAVAAPMVPMLSLLHKAGDKIGFQHVYRKRLLLTGVLSGGGLLVFAVVGHPLLQLLVGWGAFRSSDVSGLWLIMMGLAGVFIGGATGQITSSAFYASGNTRTPTFLSMISYTAFLPIKVVIFFFWGVIGLAIATTVYYLTNVLLQACLFRKQFNA